MNPRIVMHLPKKENFLSERKNKQNQFIWEFQSTYVTLITLITVLLIYYVWTLNSNATQGFTIKQLENTQNELKIELERLQVKIADIESLNVIESSDIIDIMEKPESPEYVVVKDEKQYAYLNDN